MLLHWPKGVTWSQLPSPPPILFGTSSHSFAVAFLRKLQRGAPGISRSLQEYLQHHAIRDFIYLFYQKSAGNQWDTFSLPKRVQPLLREISIEGDTFYGSIWLDVNPSPPLKETLKQTNQLTNASDWSYIERRHFVVLIFCLTSDSCIEKVNKHL